MEKAFDRRRNKNENWETQEWKAIVLLKHGDLLLDRDKYSEAVEKYEQAKEYIPEEALDLQKHLENSLQASSEHIQPKVTENYEGNSISTIEAEKEKLSQTVPQIDRKQPETITEHSPIPEITSNNPPQRLSPIQNLFSIQNLKQNLSLLLGVIIGLLLAIIVLLSVILGFNILLYFS